MSTTTRRILTAEAVALILLALAGLVVAVAARGTHAPVPPPATPPRS